MTSFPYRLLGNGLYLLSQVTRRTARYQVMGQEEVMAARAAGSPLIWVAWHGMTMMLAGFLLQNYDAASLVIMMPDDRRGEVLGHWAEKLGALPMPMNLKEGAGMATARRLARLVKLIREGRAAYVTPDGPDGPAYHVKPGVAYLAQKTGATLLPIGAYTRTGYRLNRWDRYVVPRPFSRISVAIGQPVPSPREATLPAITEPLTDALHRVTALATANYYERKP
jgi:lysophospholipid acyltransferase (LPLAT)-like uncharacterized protein